jgi:4'-phosphopantetheinyl transferase
MRPELQKGPGLRGVSGARSRGDVMAVSDHERPIIRLYTFPLDVADDLRVRLSGLLDRDEMQRARGFVNRQLHDRFIAAHGVVRLLLAEAVAADPAALRFAAEDEGRPYLVPGGAAPLPDFSLSHSGPLGALAICTKGQIGADVEQSRVIDKAGALAQTILADAECKIFQNSVVQ